MSLQQDGPAFGQGINSIPIRFALMSLVLAGLCSGTLAYVLTQTWTETPSWITMTVLVAAMALLPAGVTFFAASKLAGLIQALRRSTEAIASGDIDQPVDVECACEVGGLADSFRKMVARLNANILRMNVLAHTDLVTGLPNRVVINHVLSLPSMQGTQGSCLGALFFIDLDGFKSVNDRFGHKTGDELLRLVSQRIITEGFGRRPEDIERCTTTFGELCQSCPRELVFARFAGDEFVAFLPGDTPKEALQDHADAILAAVRRPFQIFGNEIHVGASIGIARAPEDSLRAADLLGFADFAMYIAKDRGKNGAVFFDQELKALAEDKAELEQDLRQAIAGQSMELYFQPKARATDLSVTGVEALLRWQHPTRGMVPPTLFVAIAEKAGLMPALGRFVFRAAIQQHHEWAARGLIVPVAVNVSALQFEDVNFVADLLDIIRDADVAPDMIEVEITETMVMADFATAAEKVRLLREAGLSVSVDDFGVGYSNLSQLSRLSVSALKIDRSLVMEIGLDRKAEAIILAVIGMAHAMGLKTIAEGIETPQQAAFLRKARIDAMQGYLLGLPMAPGHLEQWMETRGNGSVRDMHAGLARAVAPAA
ncbi:MAG: diguanylate cyclase/phosphodiesterase [Xanthobacteraceae bacterium]|nr:MAG: diguanylate cyclase/phosphodiesterase [Xanthobacteraceae bacterium]